jgi:capsular polysaccharide transport system permease protein
MVQIFELVRYGEFASAKDTYAHPLYIAGWCMVLTYVGLISLKIVRRHIHLH